MRVTVNGLDTAIELFENWEAKLDKAGAEIVRILSLEGYDVAYSVMAQNVYSGETLNSLTIVEESPTKYVLMASSKAILFFEFGAGVIGAGHPLAKELGMGPGTFKPNKGHALDPDGWWFPTNDPALGLVENTSENPEYADYKYWGHTYGNPPRMPMYQAYTKMKDDLLEVAKEVLSE